MYFKGSNVSLIFVENCNIIGLIACVASVSNRVIARKLERNQKKVEGGGGGEKKESIPGLIDVSNAE